MFYLVLKPGKWCDDLNALYQEFETYADAMTYLQMYDLFDFFEIKER